MLSKSNIIPNNEQVISYSYWFINENTFQAENQHKNDLEKEGDHMEMMRGQSNLERSPRGQKQKVNTTKQEIL